MGYLLVGDSGVEEEDGSASDVLVLSSSIWRGSGGRRWFHAVAAAVLLSGFSWVPRLPPLAPFLYASFLLPFYGLVRVMVAGLRELSWLALPSLPCGCEV